MQDNQEKMTKLTEIGEVLDRHLFNRSPV